jgi:hypothetical protein
MYAKGLGMPNDGTNGISLRNLNAIRVNAAQGTVTAGAGATVAELLSALSTHGLTLENFSSIQEQQVGGWTQVAAHGTGISLATVEEQASQWLHSALYWRRMICYVLSCHFMSCHYMSCPVMICYVMLCYVLS